MIAGGKSKKKETKPSKEEPPEEKAGRKGMRGEGGSGVLKCK